MKEISQNKLIDLLNEANLSPRKRAHYNLHEKPTDAIQRLFVAIEPGSYIRPHRHIEPDKWENFFIFLGFAAMLSFSEEGKVIERTELKHGGAIVGVEIAPGAWHTLVSLSSGTILMELKPGPYIPIAEKDFAFWAPAENTKMSFVFEEWFRSAAVGSKPPNKK